VFGHVFSQPVSTRIRPTADLAAVRSFAGVTPKMFLEVAQLDEGFRADIAGEPAFVRMCTHVPLQVRRIRELLRAHVATKPVIAGMHDAHVLLQIGIPRELTAACHTSPEVDQSHVC